MWFAHILFGGCGLFVFDHKRKTVFSFGMEEFFTREKANTGIELPLFTPDGKKSDHTITILGVDSDEHYHAELREKRKIMAMAPVMEKLSEADRDTAILEAQRSSELEIFAALISDWSFDQECNHEHKIKLLSNAPQIAHRIDKIASDRKLVFGNGQSSSKDTQ